MGGSGSKSRPSSQSVIPSSSKCTDDPQKSSTNNDIRRLAVDQSAIIGSFYDARQDRLLQASLPNVNQVSKTSREIYPPVTTSGILDDKNLFSMIGINKDLCLSISLKMIESDETSSLINYPFTRDQHARFLSYYYITKEIYMNEEHAIEILKDNRKSVVGTDTTHLVTEIKYGIHVIVVFTVPPKNVSKLDRLLEKIKIQLAMKTFRIEQSEEPLFHQCANVTVYSNIADIAKMTKLVDIFQSIVDIQSDVSEYLPIEYTLRPLRSFRAWSPTQKDLYVQLNERHINQIELYLYELLSVREQLKISMHSATEQSVEKYFKQQYEEVKQQNLLLEELYRHRRDRNRDLILKIRSGDIDQNKLSKPLIDIDDTKLLAETSEVTEQLNILIEKTHLINSFKEQGIEYWNAKELIMETEDNLQTIEKKLQKKGIQKRIYCFDDKLKKQSLAEWNDVTTLLINGRTTNDLVYADFSFCSIQLPQMKTLSSKNISGHSKSSREEQASEATTPLTKKPRLDESNQPIDSCINVLLLGESGVGKSTFINAIVNYFKFDSLRKARSGELVVLMPVSFLLTVGDQFEERLVRFGDEDPNEDHHHSGQSVTQHCRSYVFSISTQTKIRLIDTPGMGDTRGLDQDDLNMQHILSFIGFLGENIRHNIIFCFTNTRATFFAPGDTGPLLKRMLASHSIKDIPFNKTNTFCFDSESFRYLIAQQNGIKFDDYQKEEYKRSWVTSAKESTSFLHYICNDLKSYSQEDWQSIEHAQFQLKQMIRPMLETIRNTRRNMILLNENSSNSLLKLKPKPVAKNSAVCAGCERSSTRCGEFCVIRNKVHILANGCDKCSCDLSQHTNIDYTFKYELWHNSQKPTFNEMKTKLDQLERITMDFAQFLKRVVRISKENDPILCALSRMIDEEKYICSKKEQNAVKSILYDELNNLKNEYDKSWASSSANSKSITVPEIYKLIKMASEIEMIHEQIAAITETQKIYMNDQEKHFS